MPKSKKDFFDLNNTIHQVDADEYDMLGDYLAPLRSFARTSYMSLYVIDYFTQEFEYVSPNPLFLCGLSPQEVQEMGYAFYLDKVIPEDYELLLQINKIGFEFFQSTPIEDRLKYHITYDFHIRESDETLPILINHRLTPIFVNKKGKVWKALCMVSLSTKPTSGNIRIGKEGDSAVHQYDLENNVWKQEEKIILSNRDKEIIMLSARGLSIEDIGKHIHLSGDSVKYHRRRLFEKLGVRSINDAIAIVTNQSLI